MRARWRGAAPRSRRRSFPRPRAGAARPSAWVAQATNATGSSAAVWVRRIFTGWAAWLAAGRASLASLSVSSAPTLQQLLAATGSAPLAGGHYCQLS